MSHIMSSMQLSCWIANVSAIGVPTSATICGRSSSFDFSSASCSCIRQRVRKARSVDHVRLVEGAARGADRPFHVGGRGVGDRPDHLFGGRVDVAVRAATLGLDELPVDEHPRFEVHL